MGKASQPATSFHQMAGFPNVIGCIDGTNIRTLVRVKTSMLTRKFFILSKCRLCQMCVCSVTSCCLNLGLSGSLFRMAMSIYCLVEGTRKGHCVLSVC